MPWVVLYTCIGAALTSARQLWQLSGILLLVLAVIWLPRWLWRRRTASPASSGIPSA